MNDNLLIFKKTKKAEKKNLEINPILPRNV